MAILIVQNGYFRYSKKLYAESILTSEKILIYDFIKLELPSKLGYLTPEAFKAKKVE